MFQLCWNKVKFITRGVKYGTVDVLFNDSEYEEELAEERLTN